MKNKSQKNMLNKRGPKIDPWGTPNKISSQFILVLYLRFDKLSCTNLSESILNPYDLILQLIGHVRVNQIPWKDP